MRRVVLEGSEGLPRWADRVVGRGTSGVFLQIKPEAVSLATSSRIVDKEVGGEGDPEGGWCGVRVQQGGRLSCPQSKVMLKPVQQLILVYCALQ